MAQAIQMNDQINMWRKLRITPNEFLKKNITITIYKYLKQNVISYTASWVKTREEEEECWQEAQSNYIYFYKLILPYNIYVITKFSSYYINDLLE